MSEEENIEEQKPTEDYFETNDKNSSQEPDLELLQQTERAIFWVG